jgi:hypothetical protein
MERVEKLADLQTLGAGVAAEKFAAELGRVLENIRDPNTDPKATRKVALTFEFHPAEDREQVMVVIKGRSLLAATKPSAATMWVGSKDGQPVATVLLHAPGEDEDPRQGVLPLNRGKDGTDGRGE